MEEKPLVRWVVGPSSQEGLSCLRQSISLFRSLYGDRFDYALCYNNRDPSGLDFGIPLVNQHDHINSLPLMPQGPSWKLFPGRLRPEAHEIILDNDLLLYRKPDALKLFLNSDRIFLASVAAKRNYGQFDDLVWPSDQPLNSGIIGMPPGYKFTQDMLNTLDQRPIDHWTHFCEQGLVATLFLRKTCLLIDIPVCVPWNPFTLGHDGMHFVGLNGGYTEMWNKYLRHKLI